MEDKHLCILYSQKHGCWWPSDRRSQVISSHGMNLVLPEYSNISTKGVNLCVKGPASNACTITITIMQCRCVLYWYITATHTFEWCGIRPDNRGLLPGPLFRVAAIEYNVEYICIWHHALYVTCVLRYKKPGINYALSVNTNPSTTKEPLGCRPSDLSWDFLFNGRNRNAIGFWASWSYCFLCGRHLGVGSDEWFTVKSLI